MRTLLRSTFASAFLAAVSALVFGALLLAPAASMTAAAQSMPGASQSLPNATGSGSSSLALLAGSKGTVVLFWSNQCPWTDKYEGRVRDLAKTYTSQGVQVVLVNSNSAADFPRESLSASREEAGDWSIPYLKDEGGQLAKAFGAQRTPHVFVYNAQGQRVYSGAIDDSPGDPSSVKQAYLADAMKALASGNTPSTSETQAFGCTLKN